MKLFELLELSNLGVLAHLDRDAAIPIVDGLQAQGDLLVIPLALVEKSVSIGSRTRWEPVGRSGIELVRGGAGNNPHTLVADHASARVTLGPRDRQGLAIAVVEADAPAYLLHPEHGGTGIAPGTWVVRRQRELGSGRARRLVAD